MIAMFFSGFLLGCALTILVVRLRKPRQTEPIGYGIAYPTLAGACDHYDGTGLLVRLSATTGPEPLTTREIEHAGARYLDALRKSKRRVANHLRVC